VRVRTKRVRRSADQARALILDAAETRLLEQGPAGLRLQEIAHDVGVSHPTILHHFGSREALVQEVVLRALQGIGRDVAAWFGTADFEASDVSRLLQGISQTLTKGHARILAWLVLEGRAPSDQSYLLRGMAEAMHGHIVGHHRAPARPDDALFIVVLTALVMWAEGVMGPLVWESAGLSNDPRASDRFHKWLANLLREYLGQSDRRPEAGTTVSKRKTGSGARSTKRSR
jgi:AcrR family transcriptional regulator